ncbi:GtrA family protein [Limoniibacter endophyticus]|nr:GtrA family protein [Limoniibacter endophyticus]
MKSAPKGLHGKILRFGIVGIGNTLVDLSIFALLTLVGIWALPANILSWGVAVSISYWVNSRWSFERDVEIGDRSSFLRFVSLGALISLGVSSGFIVFASGLIGIWPAKIIGTIVAAVLNFLASRWAIEGRLR